MDHVYAASAKTKVEGMLANLTPGSVKGAMHRKDGQTQGQLTLVNDNSAVKTSGAEMSKALNEKPNAEPLPLLRAQE